MGRGGGQNGEEDFTEVKGRQKLGEGWGHVTISPL